MKWSPKTQDRTHRANRSGSAVVPAPFGPPSPWGSWNRKGRRWVSQSAYSATRRYRPERHEDQGWNLVDSWFFDLGADAAAIEHAVLEAWGEYEYGAAIEDMPQAGYTETVGLDDATEAEAVASIESG